MSLDQLFGPPSSGRMKAVRITTGHKISVIETTIPKLGADEVLVRPACCGICGTDLHILRHGFVGTNYPVTPGHEFAGKVVATGKDVHGLREGDFVTVDPNVVCGKCRWCRAGRPNLCVELSPIGVGRSGAAADFVAVPARNAFKVAESIGHGVAAMIEPLACALHAIESSQGIKDRTALVIGGGTMGLLIAIGARRLGAARVSLSDPSQSKRDVARQVGVEDVRTPDQVGNDVFDVVFEAAGVKPALEQALKAVEKTGVLVQVGVHDADAMASFYPFKLYERELRFIGSNSCADKFPAAVELMPEIRDAVGPLIGRSFPVWDFEGAVRSMEAGNAVKTQLLFS
jgi:2-desacetyl-2-hydroxyethyl bacteriochlorophyllide A dehydrogenase